VTARDLAVAALSPACRARTILAAGTWLPWRTDDAALYAPYLEQDGTPMLLVERGTAEDLLTAGQVSIESDVLPELGVLRMVGSVWPAVDNGQLAALRQFRSEHAACSECCGALRTHLMGVRVDQVALAAAGTVTAIDLDAYVDAQPDPVIAQSLRVRAHLNTDHAEDLAILVERLLGTPRDSLAAVTVDWIDTLGLDLGIIDEEGASAVRLPFRVPLTRMDDLGGRLHQLLNDAA
jgi:hypothetical protein